MSTYRDRSAISRWRWRALVLGAGLLVAGAGALWAQSAGTWPTATPVFGLALPVASCGGKSYTAGTVNALTQTTGGALCTH